MKLTVEIYDNRGRMIDNTETSEKTNIYHLVDIDIQEDRFVITPEIKMTAIKIKHIGYQFIGKENSTQIQSTYPKQEAINNKPFYWLKIHDFIILKPTKDTLINNTEIESIIITCDN